MKTNPNIFAVLACGFAVACGGGGAGKAPASAPGSGYGTTTAQAEASGGWEDAPDSAGFDGEPGAATADSPAAAPEPMEERSARAETRPGLGTEWGENRSSHVSTAPFVREDDNSPFSVAKLFYNDRTGARAMARQHGIGDFSDSSARVGRGALTVRLLDGSGRPLEGFSTGGHTYVVGEHGQRYVIQIRNQTGNRFEAVATVDGLDVINGRTGSFRNRGYIVAPFSTVEIDGFRRSTNTVAAFRFGSVQSSYANKKGSDRNVGVIGIAFFHEQGSSFPWSQNEVDRRHDADPFPGGFAAPPSF